MRSLFLAFSFLTVLRTFRQERLEQVDFANSLYFFFLVGFFLGCIQLALAAGLQKAGVPNVLNAIAVVVTGFWFTGGLHLDGVADVADGFGAGRDKESILRIMKDSRLGVFGVAGILFVLYTKIEAVALILNTRVDLLVLAPLIGRSMLAVTPALFLYARQEGTGLMFVESALLRHAIVSLLICIVVAVLLSGWYAATLVLSGFIVCILFSFYCKRKIGGITGDTLGCQNELSEIAVLLCGILF